MSFLLPKGPLLGLGEGGVQFDKKGIDRSDAQRSGQRGRRRVPARDQRHARTDPVARRHRRLGDVHPPAVRRVRLQGRAGSLHAERTGANAAAASPPPLDVFVVSSRRSRRHHARVRAHHRVAGDAGAAGHFGYLQSSRTLAGPTRSSASRRHSARRSCRATGSSISAPSSRHRDGTRATASSRGTRRTSPIRRG